MNCGNPLVSILISAYNHEKFVEKTIDSIMTQSYQPIELLVTDDGSNDSTLEVIAGVHSKWRGKFSFATQQNRGANATFNDLIHRSRGKYINLFSSDDWMLPDKIRIQVEYMEKNPDVGMVYTNGLTYLESRQKLIPNPHAEKEFPSGWIFAELLKRDFIIAVSPLIRRECLEAVGFIDERSDVYDWDLWLRIAKKYPIHYISDLTVVRRVHSMNSSHFMYPRLLRAERDLVLRYCDNPELLKNHLKRLDLLELKYYSIRDSEFARSRLIKLCRYLYHPTYLQSLVKYLLLVLAGRLRHSSSFKTAFKRRFPEEKALKE